MSLFQSLREYELFVYSLADQFPRILRSTLVVVQRGRYFAELAGEVLFPDGYRLSWDAHQASPRPRAWLELHRAESPFPDPGDGERIFPELRYRR